MLFLCEWRNSKLHQKNIWTNTEFSGSIAVAHSIEAKFPNMNTNETREKNIYIMVYDWLLTVWTVDEFGVSIVIGGKSMNSISSGVAS